MDVRPVFSRPAMAGMDFLTAAPSRYPKAISLASGRPDLDALRTAMPWLDSEHIPIGYLGGIDQLQQYGTTAGLGREIIADWIVERTGAGVETEDVLITTGAQEGMVIALLALCEPGKDALLVPDPTYLGILGTALMLGIDVIPLGPASTLDAEVLRAGAARARAAGLVPRVFYVISDYDNPSGNSLARDARDGLLAASIDLGLIIIEDVAYRELGFEESVPSSLSSSGQPNVVQLGTFSKLVFPGLRLGYLAMPYSKEGRQILRACNLAKSFTTMNTATTSQAILLRVLRDQRSDLLTALGQLRKHYILKRDAVLEALEDSKIASCGTAWNVPAGGFFITLDLPFDFGTDELTECALEYGVIVSPMRYFSLTPAVDRQVRIAYSALEPQALQKAIARFSTYITERMAVACAS